MSSTCETMEQSLICKCSESTDAWHTWKQRDFFQTPEEKCSIVEALLKDLGITEVDMVIGHSAGESSH